MSNFPALVPGATAGGDGGDGSDADDTLRPPIERLPEEVLHFLFSFLDGASLARATGACRRFASVASDMILWRNVVARECRHYRYDLHGMPATPTAAALGGDAAAAAAAAAAALASVKARYAEHWVRTHRTVNRILVADVDGGVSICNPDGSRRVVVADPPPGYECWMPTWSPASDMIAYCVFHRNDPQAADVAELVVVETPLLEDCIVTDGSSAAETAETGNRVGDGAPASASTSSTSSSGNGDHSDGDAAGLSGSGSGNPVTSFFGRLLGRKQRGVPAELATSPSVTEIHRVALDSPAYYVMWAPGSTRLMFLSNTRLGAARGVGMRIVDLEGRGDPELKVVSVPVFSTWADDGSGLWARLATSIHFVHASAGAGSAGPSSRFVVRDLPVGEFEGCPGLCGPDRLVLLVQGSPEERRARARAAAARGTSDGELGVDHREEEEEEEEEGEPAFGSRFAGAAGEEFELTINGDREAPIRTPDVEFQLITVNTDGTDPVILASSGRRVTYNVSPDRRWVAYFSQSGGAERGLYVVAVDNPGDRVRVSEESVFFFWSPDSGKLAYTRIEPGNVAEWCIYPLETRAPFPVARFKPTSLFLSNYLLFFDQFAHALTVWAPDSSAFCYGAANDDGSESIWVVGAEEGALPVEIGPGSFATWSTQ